jgi:hypothetical protein
MLHYDSLFLFFKKYTTMILEFIKSFKTIETLWLRLLISVIIIMLQTELILKIICILIHEIKHRV